MQKPRAALSKTKALALLVVLSVLTQTASAIVHSRMPGFVLHSPNTSSEIAKSIAFYGIYEGPGGDKLYGATSPLARVPIRAFHLPGEPLYLAVWIALLPRSALLFAHVPVAVLLITAVFSVAADITGPKIGLVAGILMALSPVMVTHGWVMDDMFLSAALEWSVLAILVHLLVKVPGTRSVLSIVLLAVLTALASATRLQSQLILGSLAVILLVWPRFRRLRMAAMAILLAILLATMAWGLRNRLAIGHFFIGSTHDGVTALESNYGSAREALQTLGSVEDLSQARMQGDFRVTRSMDEWHANAYYTAKASQYVRTHPLDFIETALAKGFCSFTGYTFGWRGSPARNALSLLSAAVLFGIGIPGIILLSRRRSPKAPQDAARIFWVCAMIVVGGVTMLLLAIGPSAYRYRISFDGFLVIGMAYLICRAAKLDTILVGQPSANTIHGQRSS